LYFFEKVLRQLDSYCSSDSLAQKSSKALMPRTDSVETKLVVQVGERKIFVAWMMDDNGLMQTFN